MTYSSYKAQIRRHGKKMMQCLNNKSDMFDIEAFGQHKCKNKECGSIEKRTVRLLKEFEAKSGKGDLPLDNLRFDDHSAIERNTELLMLLRQMEKKVSKVNAELMGL